MDEDFLDTHGVVLARVECSDGIYSGQTHDTFTYQAVMFLDGSVLVNGSHSIKGSWFYERSDADRLHARLSAGSGSGCSGPSVYAEINSGNLEFFQCSGGPPSYSVVYDYSLTSDCSGFNKNLFD